jgi:hypothetical protein
MDDLDAALKNYHEAFNAKLDAYRPNVFPIVDKEVFPDTKPIKEEEQPTIKPQTEHPEKEENKKTITSANERSQQKPKNNPIKKEPNKTIGKTTSTGIQNAPLNSNETILDTATEDENTNTTTETPISTPENDKPPIELIIIQRHIIHRIIHSVSFRFSIGLILLLLL